MKTKLFSFKLVLLVLFASFSVKGWGQLSITTNNVAVTQNFNSLRNVASSPSISGGNLNNDNPLLNGWYFSETSSTSPGNIQYAGSYGNVTSGDTYSFGANNSTERALGSLRSGSNVSTFGFYFKNNTGVPVTKIEIKYTGEQWRLGALGREDRLDFQYSVNASSLITGTWTDRDELDFVAPTTSGAIGQLDGNSSTNSKTISYIITGLNIAPGSNFFIRWNDFDATGADDGLGIDEFSITLNPVQTNVTITAEDYYSNPANWNAGTTGNIFYYATIHPNGGNATLSSVKADMTGTYVASDIPTNGLKLYYTNDIFNVNPSTDELLKSASSTKSVGTETITWSGLSKTINSGTTGYIYAVADISSGAINGRTIGGTFTSNNNIVFSPTLSYDVANTYGPSVLKTIVSTNPNLVVNPSLLENFTYVEGNGPSSAQTFTLSGQNFSTNHKVTLSVNSNWQISEDNVNYSSSIVLSSYNGVAKQIYVRLKADLPANSYDVATTDLVTILLDDSSTGGAKVNLKGSVTIPIPSNDLCGNPTTLTVNAAVTNGTMRGAGISSPFQEGIVYDGINDVWYKFDVSHTAEYTITVNGFSGNIDFDLFSSQCPVNANDWIAYQATQNNPEVMKKVLLAGTYFVRVASMDTPSSISPFTISVTSPKTITSDKTSLSFGNVNKNNSSSAQSFNASATYLDANATVAVTAPTNYELSLTNTTNDWHSSLTLTVAADGFLASTQVFVRFNSTNACGASTDKIVLSSAGVGNVEVAVTANAIVPATIAHTATTATGTGFTATWDAVPNATSYKVNVYKKSIGTPKHEIENFDGVVPSGNYAGAGSTYNAGWDFSSTGSRQIYTSANNFGANAPSYAFTVTGDYIKTRLFSNEILKVSFWAKQQSGTTSSTLLEGFNGTSWVTLATLNNNNPIISTTTGGTVTYDLVNLGFNKIYQIRLVFTKAAGNLSIDDISIEYENKILTPVTGSPFTVPAPATSYVVNGLESDTDYFYTVTALVDNCSSLESNEIAVTTTDKVIWKDAKWNNEIGPNENVNAEIASVYNQQADIEVKNLNVIATGSLNIQANHSVTVHGVLSQAADNQITVESDASLVQAVGSTHDGKSIIVKRNATVPSAQYNIWSSPVKAQKLYELYGSAGAVPAGTVMEYITKSDIFKPIVNPNVTSDFAKGYSAKGLADNASGAVTAVFKGVPNNGAESFDLSVEGNRFNAVGNPYPSNLDLNILYADNATNASGIKNITNLVRFWDNTGNTILNQQGAGYYVNQYAIYNLDAGIGVPGTAATNGDQAKIPDGIVKPGQGFIVRANTSGDHKLWFNNSQRLASAHANTPYYKNSSNKDRFWLALETPGGIVNTIAIAYNDLATNNNDIYDTSILDANNSDLFYSLSDNQYKQAIQSRKGGFVDTDVVKLGAKYYKAGTHKIKVIKKDGVFEGGQNIYLHDKVLNKYIDLATEAYSFDASASSNDTRFEIVYKPGAVLGAEDAQSKDAVVVYKTSDAFVVLSKADAITKVELYDMNGRLIQVNDKAAKEQKLSHQTLSNGAYLLKISRGQNVEVKKVLK